MEASDKGTQQFIELLRRSKRGKFKVYLGMSAGVGKTYRMLQEAHTLLGNGIDVQIGLVETHNRPETHALLDGLPIIPQRSLFYKGRLLKEMDVDTIISLAPEVVIVDELAHTNVAGSKNEKRWQDVMDLLNVGINVVSAVNIQHLESLNQEVYAITGIEVAERIPDDVLKGADEVVNIDLSADELILRLQEGKIYHPSKVQTALDNFFQPGHILQLRELALKEAASLLVRKVDKVYPADRMPVRERIMACISANEQTSKNIIRKAARLANFYQAPWFVLYIQTSREDISRIPLAKQRHLINSFKLATEMGAEIIRVKGSDVPELIYQELISRKITTLCIGKPVFSVFALLFNKSVFNELLKKIGNAAIDIVVLSTADMGVSVSNKD